MLSHKHAGDNCPSLFISLDSTRIWKYHFNIEIALKRTCSGLKKTQTNLLILFLVKSDQLSLTAQSRNILLPPTSVLE